MGVKLSVVIITYNEEKNIERCISSLRPVADEFIVLDSFSSDKTTEILQHNKIEFHQQKWEGFSAAKNYANSLATGDYIFSIDADEELSPALTQSILTFKQKPDADFCEMNRLTNYCGKWIKHGGWYPDTKIRIFKRNSAEWKGILHEELILHGSLTSKKLQGDLLHYSYPDVESQLKKIMRYSALAASKDVEAGRRYSFFTHALIKPWFAFTKKYFIQLGFLDGYYGLVIAINAAYERFLRYVHFMEMRKKKH